VPLERLSPASIEKARKLLGQDALATHTSRSQSVPRHAVRRPAEPTATALRQTPDPALPPAPAADELPVLPAEDLPTEPSADDNLGAVLPDPAPPVPAIPLPPEPSAPGPADTARLDYRRLVAPTAAPAAVRAAVAAGNRLQNKPYKWGGGRARLEDTGYDCSGSVSYILIHAGLLKSPLNSSGFTRYGAPGRGRWITIYARHGHVFMTVCGVRLDTGGHAEKGPRWCASYRNARGFVMRHPPGL
jgi:cell wall-associated NlpC family hydrolase